MISPKVSIITINYNNGKVLERTIKSVLEQTYSNYEYIIIDGNSTDDSRKIIEDYSSKLAYWISESDNGVYHAMNKGIAKATGDYFLMLNAGDFLYDNSVLANVFNAAEGKEIIYGNLFLGGKEGTIFENSDWGSKFPEHLTFKFFWKGSLAHQATFIHRSVHQKIGLYDEENKIVSDWKLFTLAVCKFNISYEYVDHIVSVYDCTGMSSKSENQDRVSFERNLLLEKEFTPFIEDYKEFDDIQILQLQLKEIQLRYDVLNRINYDLDNSRTEYQMMFATKEAELENIRIRVNYLQNNVGLRIYNKIKNLLPIKVLIKLLR